MGTVAARIALTSVSYVKCSRLMTPGDVKRVTQTGPLIGYLLCCPACAFAGTYLHEDCGSAPGVGYVEDPPTDTIYPAPRRIVALSCPPTCFRCRRMLRVTDGFLEAVNA